MGQRLLREVKVLAQLISLVRGKAGTKPGQSSSQPIFPSMLLPEHCKPAAEPRLKPRWPSFRFLFFPPFCSLLRPRRFSSPLAGPGILVWNVLLLHLLRACSLDSFSVHPKENGNTSTVHSAGMSHTPHFIHRRDIPPSTCYICAHFCYCGSVSPTKCKLVKAASTPFSITCRWCLAHRSMQKPSEEKVNE